MRALSVFSFLVLSLCCGALAFSMVFLAPNFLRLHRELEPIGGEDLPFKWATAIEPWMFILMVGFCLIGIFGMGVSLIYPAWKRLGKPPLVIFGGIASLLSLGYFFSHWVGFSMLAKESLREQELRMQLYNLVLEELAIREEAEGRMSLAKQQYEQFLGYKPRLVENPTELNRIEQRKYLNKLLRGLDMMDDLKAQKRFLGTLRLFEEVISPGSKKEEKILRSAQAVTGKEFSSATEFFKWLDQNDDSSWEPVPLYDFSE